MFECLISTYFENNNSEWSNSREKILLWINFKLGLLILSLIVSSSEFYGTILCKASDSISKEGIFPFFFYLRHTPHSTIISFFPFKEEHEIKNTVKTIVNVFSQKMRSSLKEFFWTKVSVSCLFVQRAPLFKTGTFFTR